MKTLLLVSHTLGLGGTEKNIRLIVEYLSRNGWTIIIFCIGPASACNYEFSCSNVSIKYSGFLPSNIFLLVRLAYAILKQIWY